MRRLFFVIGIAILMTSPIQAHESNKCNKEREAAIRVAKKLNIALRNSAFGNQGPYFIGRDIDLSGIGDLLDYLDKRFLPLVDKSNRLWMKFNLCLVQADYDEAMKKLEETIDRAERKEKCGMFLDAWTRCLRNDPIN